LSDERDEGVEPVGGNAQARVLAFVERAERLKEEIDGLNEDLKGVFGEAKSEGFDVAVLRKVLAIRRKGVAEWREGMDLIDTYLHATGDI
jgi:uncharacterized protein (UPF0335 family)